jgi:branched-chain amino acid transport system ATP-binding protein
MKREAVAPALRVEQLSRSFGGLRAVDGVTLDLWRGQVHALLGPNGAGKSTLINLLAGELLPSDGRVLLGEHDVSRLPAPERALLGIGRSFQKTNVFLDLGLMDNCCLAAQVRSPSRANPFRLARSLHEVRREAARALDLVGLKRPPQLLASQLSHGERRQLELALVLATRPAVLLLDEPLAGMGNDESALIVELVRSLAAEHAILLVEHDMNAVFALADIVTVMVNGKVLLTDAPERVRADAQVRHAYLGQHQRGKPAADAQARHG